MEQQTSTAVGRGSSSNKRTRKQILVACHRCKRLKIRCDGTRPSCAGCDRAGESCQYETENPGESRSKAIKREHGSLRASQQDARDGIDWLRSQPPQAALLCLERLRYARDPMQELCSIAADERSQHVPPQVSMHGLLAASSLEVKDGLTAELVFRYPASFPVLNQGQSASSLGPLLAWSRAQRRSSSQSQGSATSPDASRPSTQDAHEGQMSALPALRDDRLHGLNIRYWTTVPISNELAANLISAYLQVEHPAYGFFDPDLFLQDLLAEDIHHCSALLVHSILFWASCTFGPIYAGATAFSSAFLDRAETLARGESDNRCGLNVASLMVLTISTICYGRDKLATTFMIAGIRMAEDLFLIGAERKSAEQFSTLSRDSLSVLTYAAWGAFNLSTVLAMHFHDLDSGTFTKHPPLLPRPGSKSPSTGSLALSKHSSASSTLTGATFPFFCQFWCIAHDIASVFYSSPGPLHQHVPLAFAESKFHALLQWAESLPPEAARSVEMPHNVAEMHMCYHATIMDLFRPFLAQGQLLSTFSSSPRRPEAIFTLSLTHLRALTTYYHTTFVNLPEFHTVSWVHGPLYAAPAILRYERRPGWEAAFLSCIQACAGVIQSHQAMEGFLRALLGMAVSAGAFSMAQAKVHLDSLRAVRDDGETRGFPEAGFVVDQDLAMESRDAAVGDVLAEKFDELLFLEDAFEFGQFEGAGDAQFEGLSGAEDGTFDFELDV